MFLFPHDVFSSVLSFACRLAFFWREMIAIKIGLFKTPSVSYTCCPSIVQCCPLALLSNFHLPSIIPPSFLQGTTKPFFLVWPGTFYHFKAIFTVYVALTDFLFLWNGWKNCSELLLPHLLPAAWQWSDLEGEPRSQPREAGTRSLQEMVADVAALVNDFLCFS